MMIGDPLQQRNQLNEQRRKVDFDTYDVTVDDLIRRVERGRIEIAPVYQRQFRWDFPRQSQLIESILLGIPVPPLFMATNSLVGQQVQWEVVDGLQRLLTLVNFAGGSIAREAARLETAPLTLTKMEKLTYLQGSSFSQLPNDIQSTLEDRPIRVVVLNDKSDLQVRFDLFERLNTGGIKLTDQEVRECVYRGPFMDFIGECATDPNFRSLLVLPEGRWKDGTPEDYVLRFFAFLEEYEFFEHSVKDFLNGFAGKSLSNPPLDYWRRVFGETFRYLIQIFPDGLKTRKGMTPVNLFEAVSVGAALALIENIDLPLGDVSGWIQSDELRRLTTGPTNSKPRVRNRIEFCRAGFLGMFG